MTNPSESLSLVAYAPAPTRGDNRPLAIVHGMERTFPGLRLEWTISDAGQLIPLPQRDEWVAKGRRDGPGIPLVCDGGNASSRVTLSGWERPAGSSPGNLRLFEVHADMPWDATGIAAAAAVLEDIGDCARAFWGYVNPEGIAVTVAEQFRHPEDDPHISPKGLPSLKLPWELPAPEIPHYLAWLNYWSAAAARALGFPDPSRDAELLSRARRTATGGWVVQLTEAPLDLDDPAHLNTLKRTYERFPEIGGRAAP
ncbi:hypothetical protein JYJ93_22450 [Corallococcus sp. NCSPR001]|uniref:DUF5953 family protein n=2 Tax=unclassified Corallococcus TaxID=2685029 RepID=UPI001A8FEF38|nr:DUF5953 family protein [Corallococcus sp. NCSPR001]MBN9685209.1 hypothetical protein [Corallococcus sp. NCSPR001]WAS83332.1 DUF5953 family protein [Corallococcus sp. NCRR]